MVAPLPELGRFAEPALLILVSLSDGPKHGYAIMADVEQGTGRPLGPGTLYAALARLEERLADRLTAPVEIRVKRRTRRGEQGEIAIAFDSLEELNGLLERLGLADA